MLHTSLSRRRRHAPRLPRAATRQTGDWTLTVRTAAAALLAALLTLAASRLGAQSQAAEVTRAAAAVRTAEPSPGLGPEEVVGAVLAALAQNDTPTKDRGIEITFGFASPANRAVIGPIDRFGDLVRDETYRPLLYHHQAVRAPMKVTGDRATQRVIVTAATGERVVYTFALSRQPEGPFKGCWMTDGVTREPPSALGAPRYAVAPGWLRRAG